MSDKSDTAIIIGGGIAGLMAALTLSRQGQAVTLLEAAPVLGGKIHQYEGQDQDGSYAIDSGPTVFTLKPLFEDMFDQLDLDFNSELQATPLKRLARHYWRERGSTEPGCLDLYPDIDANMDAIGTFAGLSDAKAFKGLASDARSVFEALDDGFMRRPGPGLIGILKNAPMFGVPMLAATPPWHSLWSLMRKRFRDPRLAQLFARYATYCGGNPMKSMTTLMLVIHTELSGVWRLDGGMQSLADRITDLARMAGANIRTHAAVKRIMVSNGQTAGVELECGDCIAGSQVIMAGDVSALSALLPEIVRGRAPKPLAHTNRSLSAVTLKGRTEVRGVPLDHHTVFFSDDYEREFNELSSGDIPSDPTLYLCTPDWATGTAKRLFFIANALPDGDTRSDSEEERERWTDTIHKSLKQRGLILQDPSDLSITTPADWAKRFPGSGGALYGRAPHGMQAAFLRPGLRTKIKGLYLAGGSVHPSAGVPMAALSGFTAANCLLQDWASTRRRHLVATPGGMWMSSVQREAAREDLGASL